MEPQQTNEKSEPQGHRIKPMWGNCSQRLKEIQETQERHAELVRVLWRHENDLSNSRLTLFTTMQALLFAGLGIALQNNMMELVIVMCFLGIAVSGSTAVVFGMGVKAGLILDAWWKDNLGGYKGPAITGNPAKTSMERMDKIKSWLTPVELLPKAFLVTWGAIIAYLVFHGMVMPEKIPKQEFKLFETL